MSHTAITPTPSAEAASFWDKLAAYLCFALSLFGDPAALARRLWLSRAEHAQFCAYMRPLEAVARRLIFIAALGLKPMTHPPKPERKFRARLAMPANAGAAFDMDTPETWRACFCLSAARNAGAPASSANKAGEGVGAPERI